MHDPEDDQQPERIHSKRSHRSEAGKRQRRRGQITKKHKRLYKKKTAKLFHSDTWGLLRRLLFLAYGHQCMRCHHTGTQANSLTADHVVPRKRAIDREWEFANLQVLCFECNTLKGANTIDYRPKPLPELAVRLILLQALGGPEAVLEEFRKIRANSGGVQ